METGKLTIDAGRQKLEVWSYSLSINNYIEDRTIEVFGKSDKKWPQQARLKEFNLSKNQKKYLTNNTILIYYIKTRNKKQRKLNRH